MTLNVSDVMSGNDVSVAFQTLTPEEQDSLCHSVCKELLTQLESGTETNVSTVGKFLQGVSDVNVVKKSVGQEITIEKMIEHNLDQNPEFLPVIDRVVASTTNNAVVSDSTESI